MSGVARWRAESCWSRSAVCHSTVLIVTMCVVTVLYTVSTQLTKTCDLADEFQLTEIQREARGNRYMKLCDPYVSTEQESDSSATSYNLQRYCFKPYIFSIYKVVIFLTHKFFKSNRIKCKLMGLVKPKRPTLSLWLIILTERRRWKDEGRIRVEGCFG